MKKYFFVLLLLFSSILCHSEETNNFSYKGSWTSVSICDWYIKNGNYKLQNWDNKFNYIKNDFIIIDYSEEEEKGVFYIGGISPWEIRKVYQEDNKIFFECYRLSPYINSPEESLNIKGFEKYGAVNEKEILYFSIVDENEIIFDSVSYTKGTHFYRISSPSPIQETKAMINDSNVRLRNKPNLKSKTWTLLKEGTALKIKDKSTYKETVLPKVNLDFFRKAYKVV